MGRTEFEQIWSTLADVRRDDSGPGLASVVRTIRPPPGTLIQAGAPAPRRTGPTRSLPRLSVAPMGAAETGAELELRGILGEGGMGRVLLGGQRSLGRDVAVKTPRPDADQGTSDALVTEGLVTGGLEHPNIVPVHLLGVDATGQPVLVMKRVVGVSWGDLLADGAHAAWDRLPMLPRDRTRAHLEILMQVASALAFAHARGWVHRDLKPDNVMIGEFGEVYLRDWGLAARTGERLVGLTGTPAYMAPEMVQPGGVVAAHTDVYLLGASLHHVLAGTPRHAGDSLKVVLEAAWLSAPVAYAPDVPEELGALANRATSVDPGARPDGALAFRQAIVDYLAHRTATSLAVAADERLAELEAALRDGRVLRPADLARLGQECRFGYAMARREWPESPRAKAGGARCLRVLCELELAAGNVASAAALLEELGSADDALTAKVAAAREQQADRDAAAAKLHAIQRDTDLRVAIRARRRLIGVLITQTVILTAIYGYAKEMQLAWGRLDPPVLFWLMATFLITLTVGLAVGRRSFSSTTINRRLAASLIVTFSLVVLNRGVGVLAGHSAALIVRTDMYLSAAAAGAAAVLTEPAWAPGALAMFVGAIFCDVWPSTADAFFSIAGVILLATLGRVTPGRSRAPKDPPPSSAG